jgi:hypothetical protein
MKKLIFLSILLYSGSAFAQLSVNHLGLNFNFNVGYRAPNRLIKEFYSIPGVNVSSSIKNVSVNRVFSDYKVGFNTTKYRFLQFEGNVLQGIEFINYYNSDGNFNSNTPSTSISTAIESSLIGLRTMAKASTDLERRFIFNFGLGIEGLLAYDLTKEGYTTEWTSSNFGSNSERTFLESTAIKNYGSVNLVQQAGMSFRLGKDETKYPFNKVLIEVNFQIVSNFTFAGADVYRYRTSGGIFGLAYEFR